MQIVVIGCGRVGAGLAAQLSLAGHGVTIVDRHADAFDRLPDGFAGDRVCGVGFDRSVLVAAGIESADAVAAVTSGDNSNVVIARVARETFGVERVVARIYDPSRAEIYQRMGVATVAPSKWTIEQVQRRLFPDEARSEWTDPTATLRLEERVPTAATIGRAVADVDLGEHERLVALTRLGSPRLARPGLVIQEGDVLYVLAERADDTGGPAGRQGGS